MLSSRPLRLVLGALLAALLLAVSACGSDSDSEAGATSPEATSTQSPSTSSSESTSPAPSPSADDASTVQVRFSGDDVDPLGKVVELGVGDKLVLEIEADAPGELHVHSTPEQEISYPAGTSRAEIVIDRPGVVEVESHDLHKLVLQLEVR